MLDRVTTSHVDWKCYDTALGGLLSGRQYKHRLSSVEGTTEWNQMLEAVGQRYGMGFLTNTKRKTLDKGMSWICYEKSNRCKEKQTGDDKGEASDKKRFMREG